jgi:hypothetical protein
MIDAPPTAKLVGSAAGEDTRRSSFICMEGCALGSTFGPACASGKSICNRPAAGFICTCRWITHPCFGVMLRLHMCVMSPPTEYASARTLSAASRSYGRQGGRSGLCSRYVCSRATTELNVVTAQVVKVALRGLVVRRICLALRRCRQHACRRTLDPSGKVPRQRYTSSSCTTSSSASLIVFRSAERSSTPQVQDTQLNCTGRCVAVD